MDDNVIPDVTSLFLLCCDSSYLRFTTTEFHKIRHALLDALGIAVPNDQWPFENACCSIIFVSFKISN